MLSDWETTHDDAIELRVLPAFYYNTLYSNLNGTIFYYKDKNSSAIHLVIQMDVKRYDVSHLGGRPEEKLIYEWYRQGDMEYASIRSTSKGIEPLREYMCREKSLSVNYVPEFSDSSKELWEAEENLPFTFR